jgi:opacity protein-like surface antigen
MKAKLLFVLLLVPFCSVWADSFNIIVHAGYFVPTAKSLSDVFGSAPIYSIELRVHVTPDITLWGEVASLSKDGTTADTLASTKVTLVPIEGGALYRFLGGALSPYAGIGIGTVMYTRDISLQPAVSASGFALTPVAGVAYQSEGIVLDGKIKYRLCQITTGSGKVDVGGITIAVGVGITF